MKNNQDLRGRGEVSRLLRELRHLRSWDWSLFVFAGIGFCLVLAFAFYPNSGTTLSTRLLRILICLPAFGIGILQQYAVSRHHRSAFLRGQALVASFLCAALYITLIYKVAGLEKRERLELITHTCLVGPNPDLCQSLLRSNKDLRASLPPAIQKIMETSAGENASRKFEDLSEERREYIKREYDALVAAYQEKAHQKMHEHARNVLAYVDEYKDAKSYAAIAKRGLEYLEDERKRKETEAKVLAIKFEVRNLEEELKRAFDSSKTDTDARILFQELLTQIYQKDPSNRLASELKFAFQNFVKEENRELLRRDLAALEIKGQRLARKGRRDAAARAELFKLIDEVYLRDPESRLPEEWRRALKR